MKTRQLDALVLVLLTACASTQHFVHVRTDPTTNQYIVHIPSSIKIEPLKVDADLFNKTVARLAQDIRPSAKPQNDIAALFGEVVVTIYMDGEQFSQREMALAYHHWCESTAKFGDCLGLQADSPVLDELDLLSIAITISLGSVRDATRRALGKTISTEAIMSTLVAALAVYIFMLALPEPFSKGVLATLTAALTLYVGVDTVWRLAKGSFFLIEALGKATTFDEVRAEGEEFGEVLGENLARVTVMLIAAVTGRAMSGLASELGAVMSAMPGGGARLVMMGAGGTLSLAPTAGVISTSVAAEGATLVLASGALFMSSQDMGNRTQGGGSDRPLSDVYAGVRNAPGYPSNFKGVQGGTTKHPVANQSLLEKLRKIEPGNWNKIYKDGWIGNDKVSLHYFESPSGKVFNFKIKPGWSNQ